MISGSTCERSYVEQDQALQEIIDWFEDGETQSIRLGGLAGTGKTTLIARLRSELDVNVAYCAYTGKAASVLRSKGISDASTIHSLIYQVVCGCGLGEHPTGIPCLKPEFVTKLTKPDAQLLVVDEASMVTPDIDTDLRATGAKILYVGDHGQLAPFLGGKQRGWDLMKNPDLELTHNYRQQAGDPIIDIALYCRTKGKLPDIGEYGPLCRILPPKSDFDMDVDTMVICATNDNRVQMNKFLRKALDPPQHRVICLRNDRTRGVFNGMMGMATEFGPIHANIQRLRVELDDVGYAYHHPVRADQFDNPKLLHETPRRIGLWDYGYALTCHKAQGSEADRVAIVSTWAGRDAARWLYTAVTRARKELTITISL